MMYYLDDDGNPQLAVTDEDRRRANDLFGIAEPSPRRVAETWVEGYWVSTVFLVVDHAFGCGPPVLWETVVFLRANAGPDELGYEQYQERYTSRADAEAGHKRIVAKLLNGEALT